MADYHSCDSCERIKPTSEMIRVQEPKHRTKWFCDWTCLRTHRGRHM